MRLVTYQPDGSREQRVGMVRDDRIVDLEGIGAGGSGSMLELIRQNDVRELTRLQIPDGSGSLSLQQVRLCAPLPRPAANVICLGRNYYEHAVEGAQARNEAVQKPTFFTKAVTSVSGPYDDILVHGDLSREIDWEVELAVVIGTPARRVSAAHALDHVFGYMVLNDVSARDLQYDFGGQFFYGKSVDGYCPTGPWIVTADEITDPRDLTLRLRVNGVTKQEASTRDMIFDIPAIIETLSRGMTLEAGQIIATGTPAGVGFARTPPEYLQPGDLMESEIEGVGLMRNRIVGPGGPA